MIPQACSTFSLSRTQVCLRRPFPCQQSPSQFFQWFLLSTPPHLYIKYLKVVDLSKSVCPMTMLIWVFLFGFVVVRVFMTPMFQLKSIWVWFSITYMGKNSSWCTNTSKGEAVRSTQIKTWAHLDLLFKPNKNTYTASMPTKANFDVFSIKLATKEGKNPSWISCSQYFPEQMWF